MGLGSYLLGAEVKIPVQVTLNGKPLVGQVPTIEKIIKKNKSLVPGLPALATALDSNSATYYYNFTPQVAGDYIVIIKTTLSGEDYVTIDNFTVSSQSQKQVISAPRAEPK